MVKDSDTWEGETNEARPMIASAFYLEKISVYNDNMGGNLDGGQLTL